MLRSEGCGNDDILGPSVDERKPVVAAWWIAKVVHHDFLSPCVCTWYTVLSTLNSTSTGKSTLYIPGYIQSHSRNYTRYSTTLEDWCTGTGTYMLKKCTGTYMYEIIVSVFICLFLSLTI
jgi:hypothetical protein